MFPNPEQVRTLDDLRGFLSALERDAREPRSPRGAERNFWAAELFEGLNRWLDDWTRSHGDTLPGGHAVSDVPWDLVATMILAGYMYE
ncbi:MAG TPA: hypothetical protein VEZ14_06895 [Dehalococcoidia bacterium]|nr:hypothetical protein [Dehalococcoidia bacterium]